MNGMAKNGMAKNGMAKNGMAKNGMSPSYAMAYSLGMAEKFSHIMNNKEWLFISAYLSKDSDSRREMA